eukprot:scaffold11846_cov72-Skeletonema_dohrnii-CCMP3373.AAC.1
MNTDEAVTLSMHSLAKCQCRYIVGAGREQMSRGANRVVNFKRDIRAIPGCTDQLDLCSNFVKDGNCDDAKKGDWMKENCSLSCGTCEVYVT